MFARKRDADKHYLSIALRMRFESDDPKSTLVIRSGVGAVIVGKNGIISSSANIIPDKLKNNFNKDNYKIDNKERYFFIEHAERAAIYKAFQNGSSLEKSTIYCTRFPCSDCARAIVMSGVSRAVFAEWFDKKTIWSESQKFALRIMRESGVVVRVVKMTRDTTS